MKKLIIKLLIIGFIFLLTGCKKQVKEQGYVPYEPSIKYISEYNPLEFGEDYNIQVEDYEPYSDTYQYYSFYDFLTNPGCKIKLIEPFVLMDINIANEDETEFYFLIGSKYDIKTYRVMEEIQELTKDNGLITYFVSTEDILNDKEAFSWFRERFNYDKYKLKEFGYVEDFNYSEDETIPSPMIIRWWNQVAFDVAVLGPNTWKTKPVVEVLYTPLTEEIKEQYPLGKCKNDIWFLRNRFVIYSNQQ